VGQGIGGEGGRDRHRGGVFVPIVTVRRGGLHPSGGHVDFDHRSETKHQTLWNGHPGHKACIERSDFQSKVDG